MPPSAGRPDLAFRMDEAPSAGPRRGVLLLHGLTGAPGEMRYLAKRLHRDGFTVSVPLLAGHGAGVKSLLATRWRDWLESAAAAFDDLAGDVDEVHVAGICVGGALGIALTRLRPKLKSAAVYSFMINHDGWSVPAWYHASGFIRPLALLPGVRAIVLKESEPFGIKSARLRARIARAPDMGVEGALGGFPMGAVAQQIGLARHILDVAPDVRAPVLIVHAREDDQSDPRAAERLKAALGGPVQLSWLHDSYHMIHVDQERAEVAALTSRFFGFEAPTDAARATPPLRELADA